MIHGVTKSWIRLKQLSEVHTAHFELQGLFLYGSILVQTVCVQYFCVSTGFGMYTEPSVLAFISLRWGVVGVGRFKVYARCKVGFPLCSVAIATLSGAESAPQLLYLKS